jgi:HK97 family phage major capsid protein
MEKITLEDLRKKHVEAFASMRQIQDKADAEKRGLNETEKAQFDDLVKVADELKISIDVAEEALRRDHQARHEAETLRPGPAKSARINPSAEPVYAEAKRDFRLQAFTGPDGARRAYEFGRWLQASLFGNEASYRWCRDRGIMSPEQRTMSAGINSAGGYVVPEQFAQSIIDLRETYGVARQACNIMPMTTDVMSIPRVASNTTAYYVGEGAEITASDMAVNQVQLVAKKLAVLTKISSELAEDAFVNVADMVARDAAWNFAKSEDQALFIGDGTSTYGGVNGLKTLFENTAYAGRVTTASGHDTFAELDYDDLMSLIGKLPSYALPRAKWYCSPTFKAMVLDNLSVTAGGGTKSDLAGPVISSFMGYPIVTSALLPAGATTDYTSLVVCYFGDMSLAATLGARRQITVALDTSRYFEYDLSAVRVTERFALNVHDIGDTTNAGPIVALYGNS